MFQCEVCGRMYKSQREADLCTPQENWAERYGEKTADPFAYLRE